MKWIRTGSQTGIDLGTRSVKLVRARVDRRSTTITHCGVEEWRSESGAEPRELAARALSRLLERLRLTRSDLGRIAVAGGADDPVVRVVDLPRLTEDELRSALPFEARRHLFFQMNGTAESAVLDCQVLANTTSEGDADGAMRVLLVAAPRNLRDFPLAVLASVGLEPEVIDLEALAGLNALLRVGPGADRDAVALVDLGAAKASVYVAQPDGGLLVRRIGPGTPEGRDENVIAAHAESLAGPLRETLMFYRGRHRCEVRSIHLAGGGALIPGMAHLLQSRLEQDVAVLDPFTGYVVAQECVYEAAKNAPRLVTACGLCGWWNRSDV